MGNFNRGRQGDGFNRSNSRGGSGGYGGRSGGRGFGAQRNSRPQMHQAFCAECGNRCEVPFKPTGDKPVYCSNCFGNSPNYGSKRGGNSRFDRNDRDRGPQMHPATCAECGEPCEVPFKPTGEKPVLCSHCFGGNAKPRKAPERMSFPDQEGAGSIELEAIQKEVSELSKKLDKVLLLLQRTTPIKEVTVMKVSPEQGEQGHVEVTEEESSPKPKKKAAKKAAPKKKVTTKKVEKKKPATKKKAATKPTKKASTKKVK